MQEAFRHLDPSVLKTYQGTVLYGLEMPDQCLLIKVKGGYICETPDHQDYKWIRGQSLETLLPFFNLMKPLRIIHDCY